MTDFPYWSQNLELVTGRLNSSTDGLKETDARSALRQYGPNTIESRQKATALRLFLNQFKSSIILILIGATIISAFLQDWTDAIIILMIVMGSALLSFFQEYGANASAEKLKEQISFKTEVLRDGKPILVPTDAVVPGDVVLLSAGSLIPADGLLIEAKDFFVNQAVLTGETFPVEKTPGIVPENASLPERTNTVFMGTNVRSGSARVLIVETGRSTSFGQIAEHLSLRPPETEFEQGIRKLGMLLTEVMFLLVIGIFFFNVLLHKAVLDSLLFSIALAVGLTPQLLPAIININLSRGSQAMASRGVIVRRLESIENFGSMDILCTDKTGTVTVGVVQLDNAVDAAGQPSDVIMQYAWLNASLQTGMANPLDDAIVQKQPVMQRTYAKIDEIPYDFIRKRLTVVVEDAPGDNLMITKGALENVMDACDHWLDHGQAVPIDDAHQSQICDLYQNWSMQGYRVLGVAVKHITHQTHPYAPADESGMTFAGFLLFFDPPKPGVAETISALKHLGVRLKIITGDNRLVARHTGQAIGLGDVPVLTGSEIHDLRDEALWHRVEETVIFAEVDPNEKERIIVALRKRGHVVGYMGDGINDAPSLHSADVGISVANAVDVAKEAADLVLLQQDLNVLREGILMGRKTFANTLKYIFMAVSANFGNMFSMAGASLLLSFLPMLPKQILLINFLTDLPEMTIARDTVDDVYVEKPHRMDIAFIRRFMLIFGPLSSLFDFTTFALLLWVFKAGEQTFQTAWFIESILSASVVVFAIRTRLPITASRPSRAMMIVTALVALTTLILPYSPLAGLLGFTPLPPVYILTILGIVLLYLCMAELTKRWFYRRYGDQ